MGRWTGHCCPCHRGQYRGVAFYLAVTTPMVGGGPPGKSCGIISNWGGLEVGVSQVHGLQWK